MPRQQARTRRTQKAIDNQGTSDDPSAVPRPAQSNAPVKQSNNGIQDGLLGTATVDIRIEFVPGCAEWTEAEWAAFMESQRLLQRDVKLRLETLRDSICQQRREKEHQKLQQALGSAGARSTGPLRTERMPHGYAEREKSPPTVPRPTRSRSPLSSYGYANSLGPNRLDHQIYYQGSSQRHGYDQGYGQRHQSFREEWHRPHRYGPNDWNVPEPHYDMRPGGGTRANPINYGAAPVGTRYDGGRSGDDGFWRQTSDGTRRTAYDAMGGFAVGPDVTGQAAGRNQASRQAQRPLDDRVLSNRRRTGERGDDEDSNSFKPKSIIH